MPLPIERIRQLIALAGAGGLARLEVEEDGCRVVIVGGDAGPAPCASLPASVAAKAAPAGAAAPQDGNHVVRSPGHGLLHLSPAPGAPPFVVPGQSVEPETPVGLVEAMKTFTTIKAGRSGRIASILVSDGSEVEAGAILFKLA